MVVKFVMSGRVNKTLDKVYNEMMSGHKNKSIYDGLYNNFIKDILGYKNIQNLTSDDIDYFYMYLKNKTYNGHLYSESYIRKIMNLLKKILDYGIKNKYIDINLVKIKLYFLENHWLKFKLSLYLI